MTKRPTLTDLTSLTNSSNINAINQNWDAIQTAFDNTLSLDGSTPNAMNSDIDLNGNSLLNVDTLDVDGLTLNGQTVTGLATVPEWRSAWASGQGYIVNDLVKTAGNVYICLVAHTAGGDFGADLTAGNWELFVSKGDSGAGTGDMLSANNLSDVANPATSRTNLGLGTVAVENTVPVAKGGTGATDAATARTNLGLGALSTAANVTTSEFAAATLVTEAEGISSNDNDTTIPTSAAVKSYADSLLTSGTVGPTTTTSGTSFDFAVPSTCTRIVVQFFGVSLSGTDDILVRLGDAGGIETTGYYSGSRDITPVTTGLIVFVGGAGRTATGHMDIVRVGSTNQWSSIHSVSMSTISNSGGGSKTLSDSITTVSVTRSGTDTFDAGSIAVRYWT